MEESSYYLSRHAYFCLADNHYVFLDLRSDEYLCLGRTHTDVLKDLLDGRQVVEKHSADSRLHDSGDSDPGVIVKALLAKRLLVESATDGKPLKPVRVEALSSRVSMASNNPRSAIGPAHVWKFFAAAAAASTHLRWRSIERTVRAVEYRKSAHAVADTAVDYGVITKLFEIFQRLRPYYPRPYLCLFDSLALVHFLARYTVFPEWVYGVKLEPFAAHCWVQAGDQVINDSVDRVRDYTPIMSV